MFGETEWACEECEDEEWSKDFDGASESGLGVGLDYVEEVGWVEEAGEGEPEPP